jgi:hypothetical protein
VPTGLGFVFLVGFGLRCPLAFFRLHDHLDLRLYLLHQTNGDEMLPYLPKWFREGDIPPVDLDVQLPFEGFSDV